MNSQEYVIIVADDDDDDILLINDVFDSLNTGFQLHSVGNGKELIEYLDQLSGSNDLVDRKKPGLVFLDINMPIMNGIETLKEIRKHGRYPCVPVVMLTTSYHRETIDVCYEYGAVGFLTKPGEFQVFEKKIGETLTYWFDTIRHPIA
ncbi:MAG: response regulator [Chloroflexi bacterium]|nr:MAG: response regulator [Chloroflexota bacterium]